MCSRRGVTVSRIVPREARRGRSTWTDRKHRVVAAGMLAISSRAPSRRRPPAGARPAVRGIPCSSVAGCLCWPRTRSGRWIQESIVRLICRRLGVATAEDAGRIRPLDRRPRAWRPILPGGPGAIPKECSMLGHLAGALAIALLLSAPASAQQAPGSAPADASPPKRIAKADQQKPDQEPQPPSSR